MRRWAALLINLFADVLLMLLLQQWTKGHGWSKVSQLAVPMNLEYFVNRCAWTV